jgi:hypothetical protein
LIAKFPRESGFRVTQTPDGKKWSGPDRKRSFSGG